VPTGRQVEPRHRAPRDRRHFGPAQRGLGAATIGDDFDGSDLPTAGLEVEGSTAVADVCGRSTARSKGWGVVVRSRRTGMPVRYG
jgi:hypothetical protein